MATTFLDSDFLSPQSPQRRKVYIIVLNYSLPKGIAALWHAAEHRVCADGGANRLYDELPAWRPQEDPALLRTQYLPDAIKGDLDSVRPEVRQFYSSQGVSVMDLSADQDSTDLTKCVTYTKGLLQGPASALDQHVILVAGALGGRLDHTLAHLNCLYSFPHLNLVLWGEGNLVRLCRAGRTTIRTHALEGPTCALVPLGGAVTATSSGLRWNLDNTVLQVRGLLSTSNVLEGQEVVVESDGDMIWSTEVSECKLESEPPHAEAHKQALQPAADHCRTPAIV